ncbi:nuclear transport factor 2 family protein [Filimonas effusa]|uniref:Nuclear transport factor 2 family protein n=1 Tax=Filimonas effusa TaxID=2508721 RepID=A0A4Q1D7V3_9BACT|nr:nuclear transport factor 2 family protein [Filimonas effusa]RXK85321.1 nuclear transport factor 2 family protein [Filimonas effusa]
MGNEIIQQVIEFFAAVDARNWQKAEAAMASSVLLDYTSMTGNPAAWQTPGEITTAWAAFLPGFDKTHHAVTAFKTAVYDNTATVQCQGKADHFIDGSVWTVEGAYDILLKKTAGTWLIQEFKFNFSGQTGNTTLPSVASERMQRNGSLQQ